MGASIRPILLAVAVAVIALIVVWMRSDAGSEWSYQDPGTADTEPRRERSQ